MSIISIFNIENNTKLESDFCIIGAGMSGQIIASKIKNKKIIIVDSGDANFDPTIQQLNELDNKGLKLRSNHVNRVRQLGGSANLWANQLMYLDENEINKREWLDKNLEWPIYYNELKKNYEEITNEIFGKSFNNFDYFSFEKIKKYNSKLENEFINEKKLSFKNHFWPSKMEKFNIKSKFTKKLLNNKNINLITNLTATHMEVNQENQIVEEILFQSKEKKIKVKSKVFVLSCGAIENAKIILNNSINYKILSNSNTGRYYMDHPRVTLGTLGSKKKFSLSSLFGIKFKNFDLITPNEREARFSLANQDASIGRLCQILKEKNFYKNIILKIGEKGIICASPETKNNTPYFSVDSFADNVRDTVGAGDALLAYASLALYSTKSLVIASLLGSIAAACECELDGNEPIQPIQILDKIKVLENKCK